jgi:hypothetical protein
MKTIFGGLAATSDERQRKRNTRMMLKRRWARTFASCGLGVLALPNRIETDGMK